MGALQDLGKAVPKFVWALLVLNLTAFNAAMIYLALNSSNLTIENNYLRLNMEAGEHREKLQSYQKELEDLHKQLREAVAKAKQGEEVAIEMEALKLELEKKEEELHKLHFEPRQLEQRAMPPQPR